ncbi:hypothetical protein [Suttonella indologenes]|uniref:DUF2190 family protein n=1 Tax=Suttonella indologenes TaxID=13276 RepID=A0A380N187_9GAMM|nr:hypothetical protein [Suttonella indologenes]SUO97661.1 Uncharacterised protein [Suttonella indologenes]
MPHFNVVSSKITLKEAVKKGQIVSFDGHLASTGSHEPAGIAQYEGEIGEAIAVTMIGLEDVALSDAEVGDYVKANAGAAEKAASKDEAFAVVVAVGANSAEILIK